MQDFKSWMLSEIQSSDLSKIGSRVNQFSRKEFDKIPFNNIFGDKYRIVIPIGDVEKINFLNDLEKEGYEVDLDQGMVTSKIQTQRGMSERQQRIGKAIQNLIKKDPTKWQPHLKWWEQNKDKIKTPTTGVSIIISRHPIDIVRMSDHDEWHSCHATDGGYFACAIQEAKTGGAVAYVVQNKDLQNIKNLQAKDIFNDDDRGINGIHPLERIRLRRLIGKDKDILLPELRTYGRKHVGFYDTVKRWLKVVQKDNLKSLNYDDFKLKGGSYKDNSIDSLWNNFFDTEEAVSDKYSVDQKDVGSGAKADELERLVRRGLEGHEYNHVAAYGEVYDDGDGAYVLFGGNVQFSFPYKSFNKNIQNYFFDYDDHKVDHERITKEIERELFDTKLKEISLKGKVVNFNFEYNTEELGHNLNDFERFLDWLDQEDTEYYRNKEKIRLVLEELELLNPVAPTFSHFSIFDYGSDSTNRNDEIRITSEPMLLGEIPDWALNHEGAFKRLVPQEGGFGLSKTKLWNNFNTHKPYDYDALVRTKNMGLNQIFGNVIEYDPNKIEIRIDKNHHVFLQLDVEIKKDDEKDLNKLRYIDKNWNYFHKRGIQWFNLMLNNIKASVDKNNSFEKPMASSGVLKSIANLQELPMDLGKIKPSQYKQPLLPFRGSFKEFFLASF